MNRTPRNSSRNDTIFDRCLDGVSYADIAAEHDITGSRAEQIFKAEAKRRHPELVATIAAGFGFRTHFIDALKASKPAA